MKNKNKNTEEYLKILEKKFITTIEKCADSNYAFNRCKQISEAFFERFPDDSNVEIIRLEGLLERSPSLHKKWIKLGKEFAIHYALCINNETVVDYTYRQFDENKQHPYKDSLENYLKNRENYSVYKNKTINNFPIKHMFKIS